MKGEQAVADCIENELKFVLRDHAALEAALAATIVPEMLTAGYLSAEARIRSEVSAARALRVFTFKRRLANGRNVEIQKDIPEDTFDLLWGETVERLRKRRYSFADGPDLKWDIDFFEGGSGTYFALAEVEMPACMEAPDRVPAVLAPHVAFAVPRDDPRFSSRLLSGEAYARALAKEMDSVA